MIYFSFVGNHDQISSPKEYGAFCNIFDNYKEEITKIFLFITPKTDRADYNSIALSNIKIIKEIKENLEIVPVHIQLSNPVDFDLVYPGLLDKVLKIIEENKIENEEKIINVTSGSPTMTACWILLTQSGIIKNAKLIQSFEKKFAKNGKTTQEVNFDIDDFPQITSPSLLKRKLTITSRENEELKSKLAIEELNKTIPDLIGTSKRILEIKDQILNDIDNSIHVIILGERGTGKEVVAKAIWMKYRKPNDDKLAVIDCSTITTELAASELFGHVKGAFTGANEDKKGFLEENKGKMVFLDEIGNLSLEAQANLLRVLSNGEYRKIGSNKINKIDIQIIAATNKDVSDETKFAQDIKDRFDEIIELPPLRERRDDIHLLTDYFLKIYSADCISPIILKEDIKRTLIENDWYDNVRGLQKWVQRLTRRFKNGGEISLKDLPKNHIERFQKESNKEIFIPDLPLPISIDDYTELIRNEARKKAGGNMAEVDRLLKQKTGTEKQRRYRKNKK